MLKELRALSGKEDWTLRQRTSKPSKSLLRFYREALGLTERQAKRIARARQHAMRQKQNDMRLLLSAIDQCLTPEEAQPTRIRFRKPSQRDSIDWTRESVHHAAVLRERR